MAGERVIGFQDVKRTLARHQARLSAYPNVVAFGIGGKVRDGKREDRLAIRVYVLKKAKPSRLPPKSRLPTRVRGVLVGGKPAPWFVPVDVVRGATGFEALAIEGGQGMRGIRGNVGTLGLAYTSAGARHYVLTNAHVAVGLNFGPALIRQYEVAGRSTAVKRLATAHAFADVERATEIRSGVTNTMDAALCWIYTTEFLFPRRIGTDLVVGVEDISIHSAQRYFYINRRGEKKTFSAPDWVPSQNVTVGSTPVKFSGFFVLTGVPGLRYRVEGGDSGSLLVRPTTGGLLAAGLVFAGVENTVAVFPIAAVFKALGLPKAGKGHRGEAVGIDFSQ